MKNIKADYSNVYYRAGKGCGGGGFIKSIAEWLDYPRRLKEEELRNQEEIIKLLKMSRGK